jgi:GAF domain-containing protein
MNPQHSQPPRVSAKDHYARLRAEAVGLIQAAVAMKQEAAEMRLHLWLERLALLRPHTDRNAALGAALDAARSVASADCANIQLVRPGREGLVLVAQQGFRPPFLDFFEFVGDRHSACGLALLERRSVAVGDVLRSPLFAGTRGLEVMLEGGVQAVVSAPLVGPAGLVQGVLSVHYRRPRAFVESEVTRLRALARAVAQIIDG